MSWPRTEDERAGWGGAQGEEGGAARVDVGALATGERTGAGVDTTASLSLRVMREPCPSPHSPPVLADDVSLLAFFPLGRCALHCALVWPLPGWMSQSPVVTDESGAEARLIPATLPDGLTPFARRDDPDGGGRGPQMCME
jgi:hypothetical protein